MNNKILLIFLGIFCISLISATYDLQNFYINEQMNLTGIKCLELNNSECADTINCYLTALNNTQDMIVNNQTMVVYTGGYRSYDLGLAPADPAEWSASISCDNGGSVSFIMFIENRTEAICPAGQVVSGRYANGSLICGTDAVGSGGGGSTQITYIQTPGENSTITLFSFDLVKSSSWVINESREVIIRPKDTYGSPVDISTINITSNIKFDMSSLTRSGVGLYSTYITPRELGNANFTVIVRQNAKTLQQSFIVNISATGSFAQSFLVGQGFISSGSNKFSSLFSDNYFLLFLILIFLIIIILVIIEIVRQFKSKENYSYQLPA